MINPFAYNLKLYTLFDGLSIVLISALMLLSLVGYAYWKTKSWRLVKTIISEWFLGQIAVILLLWLERAVLGANFLATVQVVQAILWLITMLNLGGLIDNYVAELANKKFDEDHISRAHFNLSVKQGVLAIILTTASLPIIGFALSWIPITLGLGAALVISINHLMVRVFLRDID